MKKCSDCKGKGWIMVICGMRGNEPDITSDICLDCDGKGILFDCEECGGTLTCEEEIEMRLCKYCLDSYLQRTIEERKHPDEGDE